MRDQAGGPRLSLASRSRRTRPVRCMRSTVTTCHGCKCDFGSCARQVDRGVSAWALLSHRPVYRRTLLELASQMPCTPSWVSQAADTRSLKHVVHSTDSIALAALLAVVSRSRIDHTLCPMLMKQSVRHWRNRERSPVLGRRRCTAILSRGGSGACARLQRSRS